MALKIDPTSGNPWRGKDNKFAASPFAALGKADADMKVALGAKLKEMRAKKAAAPGSIEPERDYFAELPKSVSTVDNLKQHRKELARITALEKQRDNAADADKAKRAQRKINRIEKSLHPDFPKTEEESFELEREIQDVLYRNNNMTDIDPEMTPAEVAADFDGWVEKQPEVKLDDNQTIALRMHMHPNRADVDYADLVDELSTLPQNDISGLPLSRGTQLGTVRKGDNLKSFAYESFTTDPDVAAVYANAKQLDRSKKPAVITTVAPNGATAIIPSRFDKSQIKQQEVAVGPGYDLIVQDVFDNGKNLEITAKMQDSSYRKFQPDTREPDATVLDSTSFAMAPQTSINDMAVPQSGVDKTYYDLAQKRKYTQEQIELAGGIPKNGLTDEDGDYSTYDKFKAHAHDQAALWNEIDQYQADLDSANYLDADEADGIEADLRKAQDQVDGSLYSIYEGRAQNNLPQEQLFAEEDNGALQDVYFDNFKPDDTDLFGLLDKINENEALAASRNDSRNFKPQKTTSHDLVSADRTNADLYDAALEIELAKIPAGPLKDLHSQYLTNYTTQQKISLLQNQFVMANNNTKTKIRNDISPMQKTLPAGVPSYELSERLRAIQYASTHKPTKAEIDDFIKDSKIKEPVFHSTSIENLGSIIGDGFRAGEGEDAYGSGIYFATSEDNARIYNNSRQNGREQVVAKTYINSTQPKVLSREALTDEAKKRLGVKSDFELFKKLDEQKAVVRDIVNEYYAQGYDSISVRSKDGAVYVIARDPKKLMIGEWK